MAKNTPGPETAAAETAAPPQTSREKAGGPPSGFYMYIGPTLRGLIRSGTIYRGDRAHVQEEAPNVIEAKTLLETLFDTGDYRPVCRLSFQTPGNALDVNYRKIAGTT